MPTASFSADANVSYMVVRTPRARPQELHAFEDLVADFVELKMSAVGQIVTEHMVLASPGGAAGRLHRLVGLSSAMAGDAAFARQARRKFM